MSALPICALYPSLWSDGWWCGTPALVVRLVEHPETPLPPDDELPDDSQPVQYHSAGNPVTLNTLLSNSHGGLHCCIGATTLATTVASYRERHVVLSAREPGRHDINPAVWALQNAGRFVQVETFSTHSVDAPGAWITLRMTPSRSTAALAPGLLDRVNEVLVTARWRADLDRAEALFSARPQMVWLRPSAYAEPWMARQCIMIAARHVGWRVGPAARRGR